MFVVLTSDTHTHIARRNVDTVYVNENISLSLINIKGFINNPSQNYKLFKNKKICYIYNIF